MPAGPGARWDGHGPGQPADGCAEGRGHEGGSSADERVALPKSGKRAQGDPGGRNADRVPEEKRMEGGNRPEQDRRLLGTDPGESLEDEDPADGFQGHLPGSGGRSHDCIPGGVRCPAGARRQGVPRLPAQHAGPHRHWCGGGPGGGDEGPEDPGAAGRLGDAGGGNPPAGEGDHVRLRLFQGG